MIAAAPSKLPQNVAVDMEVDGEELCDLDALLSRFTALRVGRGSGDTGAGGDDEETALLFTDVDGEMLAISDEASLFGAVARLMQKGDPLRFRTTRHRPMPAPSEQPSPRSHRAKSVNATEKKRARGCDENSRVMQDDGEGKGSDVDDNDGQRRSGDQAGKRLKEEAGYVGMNISASGLIVSRPDVFEQLLKGRKVLARVRDEKGVVMLREL